MDYCRLCAELKDPCEIVTSITDVEHSMEQKLMACCQWTDENSEQRLPHSVCRICLDKLDKCWLFSQTVRLAQEKLHEIFENGTEAVDNETKPLATEVVQIEYDCTDYYANEMPSHAHRKKVKKKVKEIEINDENDELLDEMKYKCTVCGRRFKKRWNLTEHMQRHSDLRPFECKLCRKTFTTNRSLRVHCKNQPDNKCKTCQRVFCTGTELNAHQQSPCEPQTTEDYDAMMQDNLVRMESHEQDPNNQSLICSKIRSVSIKTENETEIINIGEKPFSTETVQMVYDFPDYSIDTSSPLSKVKHPMGSGIKRIVKKIPKSNPLPSNNDTQTNKMEHECSECGRRFPKRWILTEHMHIHSELRPYECWLCSKKFKTRRDLRFHYKNSTKNKCVICSRGFCKLWELKEHKQSPCVPLSAEELDSMMQKKADSMIKEDNETPEAEKGPFECEQCGQICSNRAKFFAHLSTHNGFKAFECWLCHKSVSLKKNLLQHIKIHTISSKIRLKQYKARQMAKFSKNKVDGALIDGNCLKFKCEECGNLFTRLSTMREHKLTRHIVPNLAERPYECWLCHKRQKSKKGLRDHFKIHLRRTKPTAPSIPNWVCEQCGKAYTTKYGLRDHTQSAHSDERKYPCDVCGLRFKTNMLLKLHGKSHSDEQFNCDQCEKSFRKKMSLKRHLEYHSGTVKKPHVCDICGNGFRLKFNLKEHRRIHTGERPYRCDDATCSENFRTLSSYCCHMKKTHGISVSARNKEQQFMAQAM